MLQKLKPLAVLKKLKEKKINLFTPLEFKRIFGVSSDAASWFIKNYVKKGLFIKLKNGLYALAEDPPSQYVIANRLYEPSYISFDAALSFHEVIPETVYAITAATPKATREFTSAGALFTYQKIKKGVYIGYKPIKHLGETILMAEPEKALADYLYFVDLKKRRSEYERMDLSKIKKGKLISYAKLFKRPGLLDLIEQLYADPGKPKRVY